MGASIDAGGTPLMDKSALSFLLGQPEKTDAVHGEMSTARVKNLLKSGADVARVAVQGIGDHVGHESPSVALGHFCAHHGISNPVGCKRITYLERPRARATVRGNPFCGTGTGYQGNAIPQISRAHGVRILCLYGQ